MSTKWHKLFLLIYKQEKIKSFKNLNGWFCWRFFKYMYMNWRIIVKKNSFKKNVQLVKLFFLKIIKLHFFKTIKNHFIVKEVNFSIFFFTSTWLKINVRYPLIWFNHFGYTCKSLKEFDKNFCLWTKRVLLYLELFFFLNAIDFARSCCLIYFSLYTEIIKTQIKMCLC